MSNGGMMAYRLACEMADTFRAVASVTGTDGTLSCTPTRPISVLHIHAKNDDHVLFDGGAGQEAFKDPEKVADFVSVPETIARWVKRDGLNQAPKRVLEVAGAYCDLYTGTSNTSQVKLCVTDTGRHSWPGTRQAALREKEAPSRAIIANDVIWDFFKNQP
jgi:polyhydroxybutyrate depolymerase